MKKNLEGKATCRLYIKTSNMHNERSCGIAGVAFLSLAIDQILPDNFLISFVEDDMLPFLPRFVIFYVRTIKKEDTPQTINLPGLASCNFP
jgi:hypothetical protein